MSKETRRESGSAMVLALFVLVLLGGMGGALLFLSSMELRMSQANLRSGQAFFHAESGIENGRATLYAVNGAGTFSDDLVTAAGANGVIDFDPDLLVAQVDAAGRFTGLTGYGDDVPLRAPNAFAGGWHAAFLTNDALDGKTTLADGNRRVLITGVGIGRDRSFELAQAIIERQEIFPSLPPATILLLGPQPDFEGPTSTPKVLSGDDCGGSGIPGLHVPVVGTVSDSAEASAEQGINPNPHYESGSWSDEDTFANLNDAGEPTVVASGYGTLDPLWTDCAALHEMIETVRVVADVVCVSSSCVLPPSSPDRIVFVDGNYDLGATATGEGLLVVTGAFRAHGGATWHGLIYVIGRGEFVRYGSGNGTISGATVVADIAGADNIFGNADDCSGGDAGFASVLYDERGGGNSDTIYCTSDIVPANPARPYDILDFRQR